MLPQLFVIGDSISMHYGPHLEKMVAGRYRYARKTGQEAELAGVDLAALPQQAALSLRTENGCDSATVLAFLRAMTASPAFRPDVLAVNCGLHDIKTDIASGARQVPLEAYRRNLAEIARVATAAAGRLVWVRTTPAVDAVHNRPGAEFHRHAVDVDAYNAAADDIMSAAGAAVCDLFGLTRNLGGNEIFCDHVHFVENIRPIQAAFLAGFVDAASK